MTWNLEEVVRVGNEKHPNNIATEIQYGTAGFRTKYVYNFLAVTSNITKPVLIYNELVIIIRG